MSRQLGISIAISLACVLSAGQEKPPSIFQEHRQLTSDLEISGAVRGVPHGRSRFVSRERLLALPQVSLSLQPSTDLPGISKSGPMVSGVFLEALAQDLDAEASALAVEAYCADGYATTYSNEYLRQHRPFFVMRIDGMDLHEWAARNGQFDASPYLIGYEDFAPAFHVLKHQDERLEPTGIVRLHFNTEESIYAGIRPSGAKAGETTPVTQGYLIARQNCLRCHNAGDRGGTKAGRDWQTLGLIAKTRPAHFAAWVHDPKAIDRKATMPSNPAYDKATLSALQRYFATFAKEGK